MRYGPSVMEHLSGIANWHTSTDNISYSSARHNNKRGNLSNCRWLRILTMRTLVEIILLCFNEEINSNHQYFRSTNHIIKELKSTTFKNLSSVMEAIALTWNSLVEKGRIAQLRSTQAKYRLSYHIPGQAPKSRLRSFKLMKAISKTPVSKSTNCWLAMRRCWYR